MGKLGSGGTWFKCDFCPREGYAASCEERPSHWITVEGDEGEMQVCWECSSAMAQVFVRPGLLDHILLKIRLGELGYSSAWETWRADCKLPDICPHCLSVKDNSQIKKAIDKVVEYWEKITGEMDKSSD